MDDKQLEWLGSTYDDLQAMPKPVVQTFGFQLGQVQNGVMPETATHLTHIEHGVWELKENHQGDTYRMMHLLRHEDVVFILHCFKKKSTKDKNIPKADKETIDARLKQAKAMIADLQKVRERAR